MSVKEVSMKIAKTISEIKYVWNVEDLANDIIKPILEEFMTVEVKQ